MTPVRLSLTVARLRAFALQMWATGVACVIACPLGSGGVRERIHTVTAAAYMADHHIFFRVLDVDRRIVAAFWGCFLAFAGGTFLSKAPRSGRPWRILVRSWSCCSAGHRVRARVC